jgi:hypothetical protein
MEISMNDNYKTRLKAMLYARLEEARHEEREAEYKAVLKLNEQYLDWQIDVLKEAGLTVTPTTALRRAKKDMGC